MTTTAASIYSQAPDLILDKLAEINSTLAKHNNATSQYKFWSSVRDTMKFAYGYIIDLAPIINEVNHLRSENLFLKKYSRELRDKLAVYETVEALRLSGTFDEVVAMVDAKLKNNG